MGVRRDAVLGSAERHGVDSLHTRLVLELSTNELHCYGHNWVL
jgi:hypothetical protein